MLWIKFVSRSQATSDAHIVFIPAKHKDIINMFRFFLFLILFAAALIMPGYSQSPIKILPLGNSITVGETDGTIPVNQMKSYRFDLKQLLQASGYAVDFVGSESSGCSYFSDCEHAGIGGSRDQYVARLLLDGFDARNNRQILNPPRPYLDEYNPDIILLHIGTNDITHETDPMSIQQVSYILDLIDQYEIRSNREVIVFLGLIINRKKPWIAGSGASTTSAFNDYIKSIAQSRISNGDKIVIVDLEHDAGFLYDDTDMADNLHPNSAGYLKMATLWHTAISENYNTPPLIDNIPPQVYDEGTSGVLELDNYITDLEDLDQDITWTIDQPESSPIVVNIDANRQANVASVDPEWNGSQSVVFTATDLGKNGNFIKSVKDTVVFTAVPVNDPPCFSSNPCLEDDKGQLYIYSYSASDMDTDDSLEFILVEGPPWLVNYPSSNLLTGIPLDGGDYPIVLRVTDGHVTVDQTFLIHVNAQSAFPENSGDFKPVLFPNPATEYFEISWEKHAETLDFHLFDIMGRPVIHRIIYSNNSRKINLREHMISPGTYFYNIHSGDKFISGTLLIGKI